MQTACIPSNVTKKDPVSQASSQYIDFVCKCCKYSYKIYETDIALEDSVKDYLKIGKIMCPRCGLGWTIVAKCTICSKFENYMINNCYDEHKINDDSSSFDSDIWSDFPEDELSEELDRYSLNCKEDKIFTRRCVKTCDESDEEENDKRNDG